MDLNWLRNLLGQKPSGRRGKTRLITLFDDQDVPPAPTLPKPERGVQFYAPLHRFRRLLSPPRQPFPSPASLRATALPTHLSSSGRLAKVGWEWCIWLITRAGIWTWC